MSEPVPSVQDRVCAAVREWIETRTAQMIGSTLDQAELRIRLEQPGWDADGTIVVDVVLSERMESGLDGRVEGVKRNIDTEDAR